MDFLLIIVIGVLVIIGIIIVIALISSKGVDNYEDDDEREIKSAGNEGEKIADDVLTGLMYEDDHLLRNIDVCYDGKVAELDKVIVNKFGVFIIEVKNLSGMIYGNEDDLEWEKYKISEAGKTYKKNIENPIKQLKRQIWLLKNYLSKRGIKIWVNGYVYFVNGNAPCESDYFLNNKNDIDGAIHNLTEPALTEKKISKILKVLDDHNQ